MLALYSNPTQVVGQASFALAALACAWVGRRQASPWRTLAAVQALWVLELCVELRLRSHDGVDALLQSRGWYAGRAAVQVGLLAALLLAVLALAATTLPRWWRRDPAGTLAILATAAIGALFLIETISLHAVDAVMYATTWGVMTVGWLWAGAALIVVVTAGFAARRARLP